MVAFENYTFLKLSENSKIKPFDCGDSDLNGFLFEDARNYLNDLLAVTYLLEDPANNKTVAYFSLLNDKISLEPEITSIWNRISRKIPNNKRRKHYPAVKIGRFAVSKEYSHQGIGSDTINYIKYLFTNGNRTGCRFITLDAYKDAIKFYQKAGFSFMSSNDENDSTRLMFYDLKNFL
ncbi:MAG: GNAT family N-acetyltransferase [Bacteroidales bacterium]|nr:GNAT family N-acetyltransferase [Bacteroidales bacterium]